MSTKVMVVASLVSVLLIGVQVPAVAQTAQSPAAEQSETVAAPADVLWVWGEIVSIDAAAKKLTVKYLDYDTDMEKDIVIAVDDKTKFEGAAAIGDLKPQDTVSIDYAEAGGINLASAITVERLEDLAEEPQEELVPLEKAPVEPVQPVAQEADTAAAKSK